MTSPASAIRFAHAERVGISSSQIIPPFQGARVIAHACIAEDAGLDLLARFVDESQTLVVGGDIVDVTVTLFDDADGTTDHIFQETAEVADTIDVLKTDARWKEDSEGYNFIYSYTNETVRLKGGRRYRFEISLNRASLPPISQVYTVETLPLMSRRT
jgi:hypothetical protein